ncbi:DUF6367 family protein [Methylobacterium aerolatum]|uniref:Tyr recombinase domain-containing protein n=1 Tax=Methylobacterium aerolatum TaxID=418708 RepID=A0ABU0HVL9_9HYPH|nr:DUF6367 family protein [Methylobacterium aerolatum]MDQ0446341.1 hypothetical protein [Methylobacterium aerolatum]GJD35683.1 hypothetical protein FMGBMHLM_2595 [Methylobacterium aerolatum]
MTLEEIFEADRDADIPPELPELVVDVSEALLLSLGRDLNEGRWTPSCVRGLYQRVDPERPEMKQRRHVHVAAEKHLKAAGKQVSWNDDGSRHDRHKFNAALGQRKDYRAVARAALGLGDDVQLEHVTGQTRGSATTVSIYEHLVGPAHHERVFLLIP